jgi:hypothetical protein
MNSNFGPYGWSKEGDLEMIKDIKDLKSKNKLRNVLISFGGENNTLNLTGVVDDDSNVLGTN